MMAPNEGAGSRRTRASDLFLLSSGSSRAAGGLLNNRQGPMTGRRANQEEQRDGAGQVGAWKFSS